MTGKARRVALYVRVSTDHQSVENQIRELKQVAERLWLAGCGDLPGRRHQWCQGPRQAPGPGCDAEGRQPPQVRRLATAWAIDRLGRSLLDLLETH